MALLPDLGSWLLRSVRRDNFSDRPLFAIERLTSLPRPFQDADKDVLVGAVLTIGSRLHVALNMLLELLPEETSRERLGEVLCPTLGQLQNSLQITLSSFERKPSKSTTTVPRSATVATFTEAPEPNTDPCLDAGKRHSQHVPQDPALHVAANNTAPESPRQVPTSASPSGLPSSQQPEAVQTRPIQASAAIVPGVFEGARGTHGTSELVTALQAELRVQTAIHVAVESLKFAEGQLKLVREINQLHGGSFDVLQKHFYDGYNRLLSRALDLERQEFGLAPEERSDPVPSASPPVGQSSPRQSPPPKQRHHSVSFQSSVPLPPGTSTSRTGSAAKAAYYTGSNRQPLARRNTVQGIGQEDRRAPASRPPLKRRLSLAEELALVGEDDSESGRQEEPETSDMATTSGSEEESDLDHSSRSSSSRDKLAGGSSESDGYYGANFNGDSAREEESSSEDGDDDDSDHAPDSEDSRDQTIEALDMVGPADHSAKNVNRHLPSRLPRLRQPPR